MASDVVGRSGRPGQDELAALAPIVDRPSDVVPDAWLDLPLVDQPRGLSREHGRWVDADGAARGVVDVEQHLAARHLASGERLAAGLGALDEHASRAGEARPELVVDYAGTVCLSICIRQNAAILSGEMQDIYPAVRRPLSPATPPRA